MAYNQNKSVNSELHFSYEKKKLGAVFQVIFT